MTGFSADRLLLFGATGDLAKRMLLPSLCALDADELLDPRLEIVGTARSDLDDQGFRNFAREALEKFLPADRRSGVATFLNRLSYQPLDASSLEGFDKLAEKVGTPEQGLAIFLSTAPSLFEPTIRGLQHGGLSGEPAARTPTILWGLAAAGVWLATWLVQVALRRRARARAEAEGTTPSRGERLLTWSPYVVGLPVFLVTLYLFFENFGRLLPGNY